MAGAIAQASARVLDDSNASTWTDAVSLTGVTAGNTLVLFVGHSGQDDYVVTGVSDGTAYTQAGSTVEDTTNSQSSSVWVLPNAGSGTHTVTITFTEGVSYRRCRLFEISGVQAASNVLEAATQAAYSGTAPSSGATSALSSGSYFVMGLIQNTYDSPPGQTISAGSGYTYYGTEYIMGAESKSYTGTDAQTATFSASNGQYTVHVVVLEEAGTTTPTTSRAAAHYRMMRNR